MISCNLLRFAFRAFLAASMLPVSAAIFPRPMVYAQQAAQVLDREVVTIVTRHGRFQFETEIADEPAERTIGLMHREQMAANHAMLFDFGVPRRVAMWMKNTPLSLDMLFIRNDGTIAHIAERTTPFSLNTVSAAEPVSHVMEIKGGTARMLGIRPGDKVIHRSFDIQ